jgi:hypothetical protein
MGYTHYYYVKTEYDKDLFLKVSTDFKKMIPVLSHLGVKLANFNGKDYPVITPTEIRFNGLEKCGHEQRDLGITWPSKTAKGVSKNKVGTQIQEIVNGHWFAGAQLETRVCGGDCSHESFSLEQKWDDAGRSWKKEEAESGKLIFECTKTAYKPYDLAVNICLIIAKHYLKDDIKVHSDGEMKDWEEGMQLCNQFLGYGLDFTLDEDEE